MSDAPKKRPLFQIHLSTCVVLMFVAGGLVWANVRSYDVVVDFDISGANYDPVIRPGFGWPACCCTLDHQGKPTWRVFAMAVNVANACVIMLLAAVVTEYYVRTRRLPLHQFTWGTLILAAYLLWRANMMGAPGEHLGEQYRGWPLRCWRSIFLVMVEWDHASAIVDAVAASGIMGGLAYGSEWLLRRRKRRARNGETP